MPRPTLPSRLALGGALLSLLAGCEGTKSQGPGPTDATREQPAEAVPATPGAAAASWQRARVGDRVTYAFSTQHQAPGASASTLAGRVTLEVVAVRVPWVWLRLAFHDEAGGPLPRPRLAQELLLPVRADETQPLELPREGTATAEQTSAAGRAWNAVRYVHDERPVDGPLKERAFAVEPGPLYLANGLLAARNVAAGFRTRGEVELKLVDARQGPEAAPAAPVPELARPLGPGTWYEWRTERPEGHEVVRTCLGAERGFLLSRELRPAPAGRAAPCLDADFRESAAVQPLEDVLLDVLWQASGEEDAWAPRPTSAGPSTPPPAQSTLSLQGRDVPVLVSEVTNDEEGERRVTNEFHAADPWHPALAGLPLESRLGQLGLRVDRVDAGGQRAPWFLSRLSAWGTWTDGGAR